MKKKLIYVVLFHMALIVTFALCLLCVGLLTPKQHTVTKTLMTKQKPEIVWQAINDFQSQSSWRTELERVERMPDSNGKELWKEVYKNGDSLPLEKTESNAPYKLVRTIADPELPFSGVWEMEVKSQANGSTLTITERGEVPNPFFRGVVKVFFGYEHTIIHYETELAKKFGEQAVIH